MGLKYLTQLQSFSIKKKHVVIKVWSVINQSKMVEKYGENEKDR